MKDLILEKYEKVENEKGVNLIFVTASSQTKNQSAVASYQYNLLGLLPLFVVG
jgi:hypothetical protein